MDALNLLEQDHQKVKKLMSEIEKTTERGVKTREQLFSKLVTELTVHERIEEKIFYPAGKRARDIEAARGARQRVIRGAPLRRHREGGDREHPVRFRAMGSEVQGHDGKRRTPRVRGGRGEDVPQGAQSLQEGRARGLG